MRAYIKVKKKNSTGAVVATVYFLIASSSGVRATDIAYFNGLSQPQRAAGIADVIPTNLPDTEWVLWEDETQVNDETDVIFDPDYQDTDPGGEVPSDEEVTTGYYIVP